MNGVTIPALEVYSTGFSSRFSAVNGQRTVELSEADLVRAAICAGYPNLAGAIGYRGASYSWPAIFRASIVKAYIEADPGGTFARTKAYNDSDPSEKGSISYYFGLYASKITAERLLGVPWVWHYDVFYKTAFGGYPKGKRPDLVGRLSANEWIVIESKGRTNGWPEGLLTSAKAQAETVGEIALRSGAAEPVVANIALISWFDKGQWRVRMDDPQPGAVTLQLARDLDELFELYYEPVLALVEGDGSIRRRQVELDGMSYLVAGDTTLDIEVGVAEPIARTRGSEERLRAAVKDNVEFTAPGGTRSDESGQLWSIGLDGVITSTRVSQFA